MSEKKLSFEEAMKKLEAIVHNLQTGSAPLEKSLTLFQEGTELVKYCTELLDGAEQKIKKLVPTADGGITEEEFEKQ